MAVATSARYVETGIMGIWFDADESLPPGINTYPNIIDDMVTQDLINTRAYSLWLDDLGRSSILSRAKSQFLPKFSRHEYGNGAVQGYDTNKCTGEIMALEIHPDANSGKANTMTVAWNSLSITNPDGSKLLTSANFTSPAVLDSGTSCIALPASIFDDVANWSGVINVADYGYLIRCNVSGYPGTLDYGFGGSKGPIISVKYAEIAIPIYTQDGTQVTFSDGSYACEFPLWPAVRNGFWSLSGRSTLYHTPSGYVEEIIANYAVCLGAFGMFSVTDGEEIFFGDTFLRSVYVVYDLEDKRTGLAPTKFGSTASNIVEIVKGGGFGDSSIASSVRVPQPSTEIAAPGMLRAMSETGPAKEIAVPPPGSLEVSASEASATLNGMSEVSTSVSASATSTLTSQPGAIATSAFDPAIIAVVACSVALVLLSRVIVGLAW
jgi:hypothetical protein